MMSRRSFWSGLLGGLGLAVGSMPAGATVLRTADSEPLAGELMQALDQADAAFSQSRPQLHYNRQRQHRAPPRRQWRRPRRRSRSSQ